MSDLVDGVERVGALLDRAHRMEDVQKILRVAVRRLLRAQGATFVLLDGGMCYYADEDSMSHLWKGQRFPVTACISGWSMMNRTTAVIPDIRIDERIPQEAYRPTFVRSMIMVPILSPNPVGAIGAYWDHVGQPTEDAVLTLEKLAAMTGRAVRRFPKVPDPGFDL